MPEEVPPRNVIIKLANAVSNIFEGPVVWFRGIVCYNFVFNDFQSILHVLLDINKKNDTFLS